MTKASSISSSTKGSSKRNCHMIHEISSTESSPIRGHNARIPPQQSQSTIVKRTARISIRPLGFEKGSSSSKPNAPSSSKTPKPSFLEHRLHSFTEPLSHPNLYSLENSPPRTSHSPTFSLNREPPTSPNFPPLETRNHQGLNHIKDFPLPPP